MPSSDRPPTSTNKQPLDNRNGDSESIFSASFPSIVASRYQKKICTPSCRKNKNTASPFGQRHSAKVYPLLFSKDTEDTRKQSLLLRFGFCDHNGHFFYWLCSRRCSFFPRWFNRCKHSFRCLAHRLLVYFDIRCFRRGGRLLRGWCSFPPIVFQKLIHSHLTVDDWLTRSGFHFLVTAIGPHLPGIDVIMKLQL